MKRSYFLIGAFFYYLAFINLNMKTRNPFLGGIIAAVMIGFGSWRLYNHFILGQEMPTWRVVLSVAIVVYGLVVAYNALINKNAE
ncbi:hypothetical protein JCM19275_1760 [Nonlabens ulvanivorans]|uniref:Uncharacterized protein n=1 Tax=Nonlabens ulvanivorans TaxID=906888 RepID=A0A081DAU5_NONUL|nr:hypothetical protein JCM19296_1638 [Nonlabens ulvanivorans]GAL76612.1 hypothetical protein JCM19275_1760 [Nonlabens ulvanivorans]